MTEEAKQMGANKDVLQAVFAEVFASPEYDVQAIDRYFDPDYVQTVDGQTLHLTEFRNHVRLQKQAVRNLAVRFDTLAAEGEVVFSNHTVLLETADGGTATIHVIGEFRFRQGKILSCDELTRLVSGDLKNRDLGSRH